MWTMLPEIVLPDFDMLLVTSTPMKAGRVAGPSADSLNHDHGFLSLDDPLYFRGVVTLVASLLP